MKFLFDENLSFKLCRLLSDIFPDSQQVKILNLEAADDREIWNYAKSEGLTLVTQDSDFADMPRSMVHNRKLSGFAAAIKQPKR
ncbi:MAG TPA: DUF5615 family PIN-like protein [Candidatus Kapabacteria bacterium]|jgi:predicted nuclease of predicted toxin-antitoxin system|nr:DUF5615 family PIN-like protein [Candidatus Kapabacteria bacterium]